jgi:hypothetical protein
MDPERMGLAESVSGWRKFLVSLCGSEVAVAEFERAVREDERWEGMARSEASPT